PLNGDNYYRLRQVDLDGSFTYSPVRVVHLKSQAHQQPKVFPNPNDGTFTITLQNPDQEDVQLQLFDSQGQLLWQKNYSGDNSAPLLRQEMSLSVEGMYFLQSQIGDQLFSQKVLSLKSR
ncbi:MAG: T9SS type A sorting domain-containing protein, partial [Bacteroidota bacterium]